jgi:hypothetical protein
MERTLDAAIFFHLHMVSDSTGETLNAVAKAACAQFEMGRPVEHIHTLVRNTRQLDAAMAEIEEFPGIVLHTMVNPELRNQAIARAHNMNWTPSISPASKP